MHKYRIAVADNPSIKTLYSSYDAARVKYPIDLAVTNDLEAAEMLKSGKANIVLISPLSYAKIFKSGDYRVLPISVLAAKGYSELLTLSIKQNLKTIETILLPEQADYESAIIKILFAEMYDIEPRIINNFDKSDEKYVDAFLTYNWQEKGDFTLDVSEDWFENFNFMLPLAFWVVKSEITEPIVIEIVNSIKDELCLEVETVKEIETDGQYEPREGEILTQWSEEVEKAIDETLDLMFFHRIVPEIIDIKVFGRDYESELQNEL